MNQSMEAYVEFDEIIEEDLLQPSSSPVSTQTHKEQLRTILENVKNHRISIPLALDQIFAQFGHQPSTSLGHPVLKAQTTDVARPRPAVDPRPRLPSSTECPSFEWTHPDGNHRVSRASATVEVGNLDIYLHEHPPIYDWAASELTTSRSPLTSKLLYAPQSAIEVRTLQRSADEAIHYYECVQCVQAVSAAQCKCESKLGGPFKHVNKCAKVVCGKPFAVYFSPDGRVKRYRRDLHVNDCMAITRFNAAVAHINSRINQSSITYNSPFLASKQLIITTESHYIAERFNVNLEQLCSAITQTMAVRHLLNPTGTRGVNNGRNRHERVKKTIYRRTSAGTGPLGVTQRTVRQLLQPPPPLQQQQQPPQQDQQPYEEEIIEDMTGRFDANDIPVADYYTI